MNMKSSIKITVVSSIFVWFFQTLSIAAEPIRTAADLNEFYCSQKTSLCIRDLPTMFEMAKENQARFSSDYVDRPISFAMPVDKIEADTWVPGSYYLRFNVDGDVYGDRIHCVIRPFQTSVIEKIVEFDQGDMILVSGTVEAAISGKSVQLQLCTAFQTSP
jgi:hypothetical protein